MYKEYFVLREKHSFSLSFSHSLQPHISFSPIAAKRIPINEKNERGTKNVLLKFQASLALKDFFFAPSLVAMKNDEEVKLESIREVQFPLANTPQFR